MPTAHSHPRTPMALAARALAYCAAFLAACQPDAPLPRDAGRPANANTNAGAGAQDGGAGEARDAEAPLPRITAPATIAPPSPAPRRRVTELPAALFATRAATAGRPLVSADGVWKTWSLAWTPPLAGHVVLEHAPRADASPDYAVVLDVDHGTRSAPFDRPVDVSDRAGGVAVMTGTPARPGLLRFSDGQLHFPALRDVHREVLGLDALMVRPESADVVVVGRARDGARLAGVWTNAEAGGVVLSGVLGFVPRFVYGDEATHAVEVFEGGGVPAGLEAPGAACARLRLARGQRSECRAFEPAEEHSEDLWFGSDWVWRRGEGLINTRSRTRGTLPEPAAQCAPVRALAVPPRLLVSCRAPGAADKGYYVFSDDGTWVGWREAPDAHHDVARDVTRDPVLPLERTAGTPAVDLLVDLEARALVETSGFALVPAPAYGTRLLAVRPGARGAQELILLDARAGTAQVVARYADCAGQIVEVARAGGRVALACQRTADPATARASMAWSEVLDLDAKVHWRAPSTVETVLADGRVLASDRSESVAQSGGWFTRLFVLQTP